MTTPYSNRRHNLRLLAAQRGGATSLASEIGLSKGRLSQMIGANPAGEIGERVARRIEEQLCLPTGWLDRPPETSSATEHKVVDATTVATTSMRASADLRENLLRLMADGKVSQSELARRSGMHPRAINRLVAPTEVAHSPTLETLQALATGLGTTVPALLSPGLTAPVQPTASLRTGPSLAKQAGRLVEDFLLASDEDRRTLLTLAAEAADRASTNGA